MTGVIDVGIKALPHILQGGVKLFDYGKTRRELAAAQKQIAEKDKKLGVTEEELLQSTTRVVAVTDELVQTREKLSHTEAEYDDYRETMQLVIWGGGAVIVILLLVVVLTSVRHA